MPPTRQPLGACALPSPLQRPDLGCPGAARPHPSPAMARLTSASPDPGQALSRPPSADPMRAFTHPVPSSGPICGPSCLHPALPLLLSSQATEIFHFKNDQMRSFS